MSRLKHLRALIGLGALCGFVGAGQAIAAPVGLTVTCDGGLPAYVGVAAGSCAFAGGGGVSWSGVTVLNGPGTFEIGLQNFDYNTLALGPGSGRNDSVTLSISGFNIFGLYPDPVRLYEWLNSYTGVLNRGQYLQFRETATFGLNSLVFQSGRLSFPLYTLIGEITTGLVLFNATHLQPTLTLTISSHGAVFLDPPQLPLFQIDQPSFLPGTTPIPNVPLPSTWLLFMSGLAFIYVLPALRRTWTAGAANGGIAFAGQTPLPSNWLTFLIARSRSKCHDGCPRISRL